MARSRQSPLDHLKTLLRHVEPLSEEAITPIRHYNRSSADHQNLLSYFEDRLEDIEGLKQSVLQRHCLRFHGMLVVQFIETLERFFKESAAVCIDLLGHYVLDDRFDIFRVQGSTFAVHFGTDTLGRALCESATWLDTSTINARFKSVLSDPFEDGKFVLFPNGRKDLQSDRERFEALELIWQLRHTQVHNVGVITQSDAVKFRLMIREPVESPRLIAPTWNDIIRLKRFLDETAKVGNERIGTRVAELLTTLHANDPTLFTPQEMADQVTVTFGFVLNVAGATGVLPLP